MPIIAFQNNACVGQIHEKENKSKQVEVQDQIPNIINLDVCEIENNIISQRFIALLHILIIDLNLYAPSKYEFILLNFVIFE